MDGQERELQVDQLPDFREITVRFAALVCDQNMLVMEIDVNVLMRGLDLAVFETSGRQKSKMVCVETSSCKATTRMRRIRVDLLLACFLDQAYRWHGTVRNTIASRQPPLSRTLVGCVQNTFPQHTRARGSEGWRSGFSMVEPWTKKGQTSTRQLRRRVVWAVGSVESGLTATSETLVDES